MPHIQVFSEVPARDGELDALRCGWPTWRFRPPFALVLTEARLELHQAGRAQAGGRLCGLHGRAVAHRKFGGGAASPSPRRWG